jgi:hypothetical protein
MLPAATTVRRTMDGLIVLPITSVKSSQSETAPVADHAPDEPVASNHQTLEISTAYEKRSSVHA